MLLKVLLTLARQRSLVRGRNLWHTVVLLTMKQLLLLPTVRRRVLMSRKIAIVLRWVLQLPRRARI